MNLQYFHGRKSKFEQEFTICVDVPSKELLISDINDVIMGRSNKISVSIGWAIVSKKDQYDKKTGRTISLSRVNPVEFELFKISRNSSNSFTVRLDNDKIRITLEYKNGRNKIFFLHAEGL